jgi:hypothetical protein
MGGLALVLVAGCGYPHAPKDATDARDAADVEAGYKAYHDVLLRWGTWESDPFYAARWCPREEFLKPSPDDFSPLALVPSTPGASPGSSFTSDDNETWHEITTRGGRWIHGVDDRGRWCWVPSVIAGQVRVVERAHPPDAVAYADAYRAQEPSTMEKIGDGIATVAKGAAAIADATSKVLDAASKVSDLMDALKGSKHGSEK